MTSTNSALLVIDFINDIVHPDGKIASSAPYIAKYQVIEHANQALAFARQNQWLILFIKVGFSKNYLECPLNSPIFGRAKELGALQLKSWGTEFYERLDFEASEPVIVKHRISAFYNTDLETYLRAQKIQTLLLSGVSTDMAIQTTAREAHDRDYRVIVIEDACGASNEKFHQNSIETLARIATIIKSNQLIKLT